MDSAEGLLRDGQDAIGDMAFSPRVRKLDDRAQGGARKWPS
jgi:hypothetical protein